MRGRLAGGLVILLAVVILIAAIAVVAGSSVKDIKSMYEVLLPPVVALTGTAMGFYFAGGQLGKK